MDYKGYELRFNVRWLVRGVTHNAAVGVFKDGQMIAPCADIYLAQRFIDQRVKLDEKLGRIKADGTKEGKPKRTGRNGGVKRAGD